jgi:DNA-directed RNA polymerase subunit RPC12/RpoP
MSGDERLCPHCGTPVTKDRAIYCSWACKRRAQRKRAAIKIREKRYAGRVCEDCGKDFSNEQRRGAVRCKECAHKRHNQQRLELHRQRGRTWADVVAYANRDDELRDIQACRIINGMRPLEPGRIPCLCCHELFDSSDIRTHRLCPECQHQPGEPINDYYSRSL